MDQAMEAARRAIRSEGEAVLRLLGAMDWEAFRRAATALLEGNKTVVCACGSSGIAARKLAHSLNCIERPAVCLEPSEALHGGMGVASRGDVLVAISRGGRTEELLGILDGLAPLGCPVIAITEGPNSPLAKRADILLPLSAGRECDPLDTMATSSFAQTIAILDALLCALMVQTGYTAERFARIHPGGAVGERLRGGER